MPEGFSLNEGETASDTLRRIWEDKYNSLIAEQLLDGNDPLDEENCWYEEDMGQIAWADGDTMEFYVVDVEGYK